MDGRVDIRIMYRVARVLNMSADEFGEFLADGQTGNIEIYKKGLQIAEVLGRTKDDPTIIKDFEEAFDETIMDGISLTKEQIKELNELGGADFTLDKRMLKELDELVKEKGYEEAKKITKEAGEMSDFVSELLKGMPKDTRDDILSEMEKQLNRNLDKFS